MCPYGTSIVAESKILTQSSVYVKEFQELSKAVTDDVLKKYMTPRKLEWKGNPNPVPKPEKAKGAGEKAKGAGEKAKGGGKKEAQKEASKAAANGAA